MMREDQQGFIALVGERSLVLGFRLIGVENTFIAENDEGVTKFKELFESKKYSLIMASENIRNKLDRKYLDQVDMSTSPLVVFIPLPGGSEEESVGYLAKKILGVDLEA